MFVSTPIVSATLLLLLLLSFQFHRKDPYAAAVIVAHDVAVAVVIDVVVDVVVDVVAKAIATATTTTTTKNKKTNKQQVFSILLLAIKLLQLQGRAGLSLSTQ